MSMRPREQPQFTQVLAALLRDGRSVRFRASGWSMHPTIRNDEIITVAPIGGSPIRVGDVVLYRRARATIAHRVIAVRSSSKGSFEFVLRGDAADFADRPVGRDQILGRVQAVERGGRTRALGFLSRSWSRALGRMRRSARALRTISFSSLRKWRVRVT